MAYAAENFLSRVVSEANEHDAYTRYREEAAEHNLPVDRHPPPHRPSSVLYDDFEDSIVSWEEKDPGNPYNWAPSKKVGILLTAVMLIVNSTMGSALPSNAIPFIEAEWNVTNHQQQVLPISVYLIGYVMGKRFHHSFP